MAFDIYASAIAHTSDATFRAWGLDLSTLFDTIGFTQSGDSGQINWVTVTRPGVSTSGGYEIRYLDDSLHGTAPIYVKLEFGTGNNAAYPALWITVGTGTDGAGTITGTVFARELCRNSNSALASTVTAYPTYACLTEGAVWFALKAGARNYVTGWALLRTNDATGAPDGRGVVIYRGPNNNSHYAAQASVYVFATGYAKSSTDAMSVYGGDYTQMTYGLTATVVGGVPGSFQCTRHFTVIPTIIPMMQVVSLSNTDGVSRGTTFDATTVGATQHKFMSLGTLFSYYDTFGLIWE